MEKDKDVSIGCSRSMWSQGSIPSSPKITDRLYTIVMVFLDSPYLQSLDMNRGQRLPQSYYWLR